MNADAYRRVQRAWHLLGSNADMPELQAVRESVRRDISSSAVETSFGKWRAWAAAIVVAAGLGIAGYFYLSADSVMTYTTAIGQRSQVELADGSTILLDGRSRVTVRLTSDVRAVELHEGQAQFSVAKDPSRPFRVAAGDHEIMALGTSFNVELVGRRVEIAMLEGKVRVSPRIANGGSTDQQLDAGSSSPALGSSIELSAGQGITIQQGGFAELPVSVDLAAVMAWQQGRIVFKGETLGDAVSRLSRYSQINVAIDDPALAALEVNGVFSSGDVIGFIDAVRSYWPDVIVRRDGDSIHLASE